MVHGYRQLYSPKDVKIRFYISSYELYRPLPKAKYQKVIGSMKDEFGGKITAEFAALRPKTHSYLTDNNDKNKKAKATKKFVIKIKPKFDGYKHCLEVTQLEKN